MKSSSVAMDVSFTGKSSAFSTRFCDDVTGLSLSDETGKTIPRRGRITGGRFGTLKEEELFYR